MQALNDNAKKHGLLKKDTENPTFKSTNKKFLRSLYAIALLPDNEIQCSLESLYNSWMIETSGNEKVKAFFNKYIIGYWISKVKVHNFNVLNNNQRTNNA